jgi:hypothetical protein
MNIKDILKESSTDLVARYYRMPADADAERLNMQAEKVAEQNREHYAKYFGDFFKYGNTPVFTTEDNNVTEAKPLNNKPEDPQHASNGYRGLKHALRNSKWGDKK